MKFQQMEPLKLSQQVFTYICVRPAQEGTSQWKKIFYFIFTCVIFLAIVVFVTFAIIYLKQIMFSDMKESLYALFQIIAFSDALYGFAVMILCRCKINLMFDQLSDIYRECKNRFKIQFYFFQINSLKLLVPRPPIVIYERLQTILPIENIWKYRSQSSNDCDRRSRK